MLANTVLVFTSDNGGGPWGHYANTGSNWPLRGAKGKIWEGGVRVPALVWSPLLRSLRGSLVTRMAHAVDWLPTLYSAAGGHANDLGTLDGLDLWPWLREAGRGKGASWPRKEFLVNVDADYGQSAYREGDYKLVSIAEPSAEAMSDFYIDASFNRRIPTPGNSPQCGTAATVKYLNALMMSSLTWKKLQRLYSYSGALRRVHSRWRQRALVHCNPWNLTALGPERLRDGYYLFDLAQDPCELSDLSSRLQPVVARIARKLRAYEAAAQPPKRHMADPRGMPEVNNCVWARFQDVEQTASRRCPCPGHTRFE
ncbi:hypothetical protein V5799_024373 [Amblyomma americanum]|uniref:Sulfatase N-terminal domain-containing protein n=1 Tax=Amblyomma americanum TaxID=6943 RepID=A0AAQ4ECS0_AMBAM